MFFSDSGSWNHITLNGDLCPEYWLYAHCAALERVPVVFVSGDSGICEFASSHNPAIGVNVTNTGKGDSVIAVAPAVARAAIRAGMQQALQADLAAHVLPRADHYELRLVNRSKTSSTIPYCILCILVTHGELWVMLQRFEHHGKAFKAQFYPRARLEGSQTVVVESDTLTDIASVFQFF